MALAKAHNLFVIEDSAQAIGADYKGQPVCSFGHISCLSFYPTKNLGAYGDAGMAVTNDPALAEKLDVLRRHGSKKKYHADMLGFNSRLDALQAAILGVTSSSTIWMSGMKHVAKWQYVTMSCSPLYPSRHPTNRVMSLMSIINTPSASKHLPRDEGNVTPSLLISKPMGLVT
jgi:dTDP-4-amino-4,6-dideoxygalactose transaminase